MDNPNRRASITRLAVVKVEMKDMFKLIAGMPWWVVARLGRKKCDRDYDWPHDPGLAHRPDFAQRIRHWLVLLARPVGGSRHTALVAARRGLTNKNITPHFIYWP
jgi:hypothetical protein